MMLVIELVTTVLLLFAGATAQKPKNLGEDASGIAHVAENGPVLHLLLNSGENPSTNEGEYTRDEIFGKGLDSEENKKDEFDNDDDEDDNLDETDDDWVNPDDYEDYDDDLDDEDEDETEEEGESKERFKRKIIYRGQGGGGIYSRGGRRGYAGGGGDEDPYGRRRDHHNRGPSDSWPYRNQDTPVHNPAPQNTPSSTGSSSRTDSAPVYGTQRKTEGDGGRSGSPSSTSNASGRNAGKRTKTERRETSKSKLSKNLKDEIAQYAIKHGPQSAAEYFQERIGRKLKARKIEKLIRRYQERQ